MAYDVPIRFRKGDFMMPSILPFIVIGIYTAVAVLAIVTSILYDIRIIQLNRASKQHPYAKWRRSRPHMSIVIRGSHMANSEMTAKSITANHYAHKTIVRSDPLNKTDSSLNVYVQAGDVFSPTMLLESVQYMLYFKSHTYTISPALNATETASAIIKNYLLIVDQLFGKMRTILRVTKSRSFVMTATKQRNYMTTLYSSTAIFVATMTSLVILFSTYLAIAVEQPAILLGIVAFFSIYILIAIVTDERLTLKEKVVYCVLIPISFPVFYIIGIMNPFFRVGSLLRSQSLLRSFGVYARS